MKKRIVWSKILIAGAVLMAAALAAGEARSAAPKSNLVTVLNPAITEKLAARVPLAPRLDTLEGKTIYLVDMNYEGFGRTAVLYEMQAWLNKNVPGIKTVLRLKSGSYISDDPGLWKEIAASKADGVIIGVAG